MSHVEEASAAEDYSLARKAVLWHFLSITLSTSIILLIFTTRVVEIIFCLDVLIFIEFILFYKSIWTLFLNRETPISTYGLLAKLESNFGVFFWLFSFILVALFVTLSVPPFTRELPDLRALNTWLTLTRCILLPLWLLYVGISIINIKRAYNVQAKHKIQRSLYEKARHKCKTLKNNLATAENKISLLKQELSIYKESINQIKEIEANIQRIIVADPANLTVKANEIRKQVENLPIDTIREEKMRIDQELLKVNQIRKKLEVKLNTLKEREKTLKSALKQIKHRIEELKIVDPANVEVQLQILREKWNKLNESEIENVIAYGGVAQLLKEQLILKHNLKTIRKEIDVIEQNIRSMSQDESILRLKKLIVEQKEVEKDFEINKPHVSKIEAELEKLEKNCTRLRAQMYICEKISRNHNHL
jgi:hypothetical protein